MYEYSTDGYIKVGKNWLLLSHIEAVREGFRGSAGPPCSEIVMTSGQAYQCANTPDEVIEKITGRKLR